MPVILVVDDEPQIRESLRVLLQIRGFADVQTASTAKEAMEVAARQPPDLLIVDWMLADDVDGLDLAVALRDANPLLPIIVVTGYLSEELQQRTSRMERLQVLAKPCPYEEFTRAVDEALQGTVLSRELDTERADS